MRWSCFIHNLLFLSKITKSQVKSKKSQVKSQVNITKKWLKIA